MIVRVAVPRLADGGVRDRSWERCRRSWETWHPAWELVEGEHKDGTFNRSAAVNRAAAGAWDALVIADADVLIAGDRVAAGVDLACESGQLVFPFTERLSLNQAGSARAVRGGGLQRKYVEETQDWNVSTCVVLPRRLWDEIGGMDERFVGWGGEDEALFCAAVALGGGFARLDGAAWHLWHPPAPWRDFRSPDYLMAVTLLDRYLRSMDAGLTRRAPHTYRCSDPAAMRALLAESRAPDQVAVVVLTNGERLDMLATTITSLDQQLRGPIGRRVIVADGCAPRFAGWDTVTVEGGTYTTATAAAQRIGVGSGQAWVFFSEDDFVFPEPVDLVAMQATMTAHPELVQLSLLRQPWYDYEIEAGGIVEAKPDAFTQRDGYVEHRDYWAQNPHLARRSFMAAHPWPKKAGSERRYGNQVFVDPAARAGIWGSVGDAPRCVHIGAQRAGTGY